MFLLKLFFEMLTNTLKLSIQSKNKSKTIKLPGQSKPNTKVNSIFLADPVLTTTIPSKQHSWKAMNLTQIRLPRGRPKDLHAYYKKNYIYACTKKNKFFPNFSIFLSFAARGAGFCRVRRESIIRRIIY